MTNLTSKLKGGFRNIKRGLKRNLINIILSATAGAFLYGAQCVPNPPPKPDPKPENNPPEAILYVNPTSGQAPLEVLIQLEGEDKDENDYITKYVTGIDKNENDEIDNDEIIKTSSYPINEEIFFNTAGSYKILGQVTDSKGLTDKKSLSVIVSNPYDPTVDLSSIPESEKNFNEESETIINLPTPYDTNPEDEPVWYTDARALEVDGKIKVNVDKSMLDGNKLILTGITDLTGIYQVELELKNIKDEIGKAILQGEIYNLIDIQGFLQDNETDSNQAGVIRVYDSSDNSLLEEILTSNGNFSFQLNERVSQAIVQARLEENGTPKSYVRTVRLDDGSRDYQFIEGEDKPIRVVPFYGDGIISIDFDNNGLTEQEILDFRAHVRLTNGSDLSKFDLTNFNGIMILKNNRNGSSQGYFLDLNDMELRMISSNIAGWFDKEQINIDIDNSDTPNPSMYLDNHWIVVEPYNTLPSGVYGETSRIPTNEGYTVTKAALIKVLSNSDNPLDYVLLHEGGHGSNVSVGEAYWRTDEMPNPDPSYIDPILSYRTSPSDSWNGVTVMETGIIFPINPVSLGKADLKEAKIVNKETYKARERLLDILRINWGFADELNP